MKYKILCLGPLWRGSNANGLFYALGRLGHVIKIIDDRYYFNFRNRQLHLKIIDRLFRRSYVKNYNESIIREAVVLKPDIILVFKGAFVEPSTIRKLKNEGFFTCNFYPDVSFMTHTSFLPQTLPEYDLIFSTKSFGRKDMMEKLGIDNVKYVPHGFDPNIHRKLDIQKLVNNPFLCDVSFIGGYSLKKSTILHQLKEKLPEINLKIFGEKWNQNTYKNLESSIAGHELINDYYSLCVNSSRVNLGLLHEKVGEASSGDLITSRTFHITGCGGFMIHERTPEVLECFTEGKEIICFDDVLELAEKVRYYLSEEHERLKIADSGHQRALSDHSLDIRAKKIINDIEEQENFELA